jgi:hypothetical protein
MQLIIQVKRLMDHADSLVDTLKTTSEAKKAELRELFNL